MDAKQTTSRSFTMARTARVLSACCNLARLYAELSNMTYGHIDREYRKDWNIQRKRDDRKSP